MKSLAAAHVQMQTVTSFRLLERVMGLETKLAGSDVMSILPALASDISKICATMFSRIKHWHSSTIGMLSTNHQLLLEASQKLREMLESA